MCIIVCLYLFLSFVIQCHCLSFFERRLLNTILVFANYSFTIHRLNNIISYKNTSFNWARWSVSVRIFYNTQKGKYNQLFATHRHPIDENQCRHNAWAHWGATTIEAMLMYVCSVQHVALMCKYLICWNYQYNRYTCMLNYIVYLHFYFCEWLCR